MKNQWVSLNPASTAVQDRLFGPPAVGLSWFWSAGNARNLDPHLRLTSPVLENVSDCTHWMPYKEGDSEPEAPWSG